MSGHEMRMAYEASRREYVRDDDSKEALALTRAGKFVIVDEGPVFCPRTDAIMTSEIYIRYVYNTLEEAEALLKVLNYAIIDDYVSVYLFDDPENPRPRKDVPAFDDSDDDCPF